MFAILSSPSLPQQVEAIKEKLPEVHVERAGEWNESSCCRWLCAGYRLDLAAKASEVITLSSWRQRIWEEATRFSWPATCHADTTPDEAESRAHLLNFKL